MSEPLDIFLSLSTTLTGERHLDPALAAEYLDRVRAMPEAAELNRLLATFDALEPADLEAGVATQIMADDGLKKLVLAILMLWYFGERRGEKPEDGPPEHYFRGLFWQVISAHPLALSGGYFGHWSYPPDN